MFAFKKMQKEVKCTVNSPWPEMWLTQVDYKVSMSNTIIKQRISKAIELQQSAAQASLFQT